MKTKYLIFISAFMLIISACEKKLDLNFGFNSEIKKDSHGLVVMDVTRNTNSVYLFGKITLDEGSVRLELVRPEGTNAYAKTFEAPAIIDINEVFPSESGYWSLKYRSENGKGNINLYIND